MNGKTITRDLVDFITCIQFKDLDTGTIEKAKQCVQDIIGAAICGSKGQEGRIWYKYFSGIVGGGQANVWKAGFASMEYHQCAGFNAACGHLLDMDDVHNSSITHLGVVTIPAALAVCQKLRKGGEDLLAAIVAAYEVGARIGEAVNPSSYHYWHTTGIVAPFCSAIAVGKLIGLNSTEMLHAFGNAGTQAAGLWEFLEDGAMSKALHTANGTLCGMRAAELAKLGLTGASKILEGRRGLINAIAPSFRLEALTESFAGPYKIMTNSFKPYACCRHIHSAVYAVEKALAEQDLKAGDVDHIEDRTYRTAAELTDNPSPATSYAAKFSLQYCIAASLRRQNLAEDTTFTVEKTTDPATRALMKKITIVIDDAVEKEHQEHPNKWTHILKINRKNNPPLNIRIDYPLGDFQNPFTWDMADEKFRRLVGDIPQREELIKRFHTLEQSKDLSGLFVFDEQAAPALVDRR
jgi:2-methylcitrate dehydratase PrpD